MSDGFGDLKRGRFLTYVLSRVIFCVDFYGIVSMCGVGVCVLVCGFYFLFVFVYGF